MAKILNKIKKNIRKIPFYKTLRRKQIEYSIKLNKLRGKEVIHFIHIGKTAGTSIKYAFNQTKLYRNEKIVFVLHNHEFCFTDVPADEKAFFIVRDPIDRFVSGFFSRYREGQPRIYNPWRPEEAEVFEEFSTPNEMTMALTSSNLVKANLARKGFSNIGHVNTSYWDWFNDEQYLENHLDSIGYVAKIENLNEDFKEFKSKYNISDSINLPENKEKKHKNPDHFNKDLEPEAVKILKNHYSREYDFLDFLYDKGFLNKKYE